MLMCDECGRNERDAEIYRHKIVAYTGNKIEYYILKNDLCSDCWEKALNIYDPNRVK